MQTWHKIVHTVHIILIQYSFLFGIRQTLYTLSKIPECAENYVSKETLPKILIRNTGAKHQSTTQNGFTKIGRTKISRRKLVDTKISREERVVESITIFENHNINNLRVRVGNHIICRQNLVDKF